MENPLVSIVIITWNRREEIIETIKIVNSQAYRNFELIVVDNGSEDDTVESIKDLYPGVKLVVLDSNIGVAARNAGVRAAQGEIIFFLDSDAGPGRATITNLVYKFRSDPKVGVINSKIVNASTNQLDNFAGWSYSEKDKDDQDKEFLSFSFSEGGAAILKRVFDDVGLFWEPLFFGCEGFELSLRALDAGYDILYYPSSIVYHRVVQQSRVSGGQRDCLFLKNFLSIYLVRFPWWMLCVFMPLKIGATLIRGIRRGYLEKVFLSLFEFGRQIPSLLRERRPIKGETAHYYWRLQRQHGSLRWDLFTWFKFKA